MDENERKILAEKKNRLGRVRRLKNLIMAFLCIWIVLTIVLGIFLLVKVTALEKEVEKLSARAKEPESAATEDTVESESDSLLIQSDSGTGEENLRDPDETFKVYLTFDDGPSANSDAILDTLDDYGVKATFFVVGKEDDHSKSIYQRIVSDGHTIGMHSYSHKYSEIYQSLDAFKADFQRIHDLIENVTGVDSRFYRFPGGSSNKVSNTDMSQFIRFLNQNGITYVDWNVQCGDATTQNYTVDDLVENVMSDVLKYKTSVVLLHDADDKTKTVEALPKLIESLQSEGAVILPISDDTKPIQHVTLKDG